MTKAVIPYNPSFKDLEPDNVKLQNVNCHKKRQNLLNELSAGFGELDRKPAGLSEALLG